MFARSRVRAACGIDVTSLPRHCHDSRVRAACGIDVTKNVTRKRVAVSAHAKTSLLFSRLPGACNVIGSARAPDLSDTIAKASPRHRHVIATSSPRHRHVIATSSPRHRHVIATSLTRSLSRWRSAQYGVCGTRTGRHCFRTGFCANACDPFSEGAESELAPFGVGVVNYFKFLKWLGWIYLVLFMLSFPQARRTPRHAMP